MAESLITLDNIKYIIAQMQAYFMAPFARQLTPGAKINGVLFNGYNDISIPSDPTRNIELLANNSVSILFDNDSEARMVMKNDGIYFDEAGDGTKMLPIIQITKESSGKYSIVNNTVIAPQNDNTIGFKVNNK